MTEPRRIQRHRTRGWRMPEGAVYVGRPTKWGNPHVVQAVPNGGRYAPGRRAAIYAQRRRLVVARFERDLREGKLDVTVEDVRRELARKNLVCWCPLVDPDGNPVPCHADVLLAVANEAP